MGLGTFEVYGQVKVECLRVFVYCLWSGVSVDSIIYLDLQTRFII